MFRRPLKNETLEQDSNRQSTDESWGIADLAAHFNITPRAIRFYEAKGLISPRRNGTSRIFSAADKDRLDNILLAKRIGFPLDDIKVVQQVADGDVKDHASLVQHKDNFEIVIARLKSQRKDIDVLTKHMQALCTAIDEHIETSEDQGVFQFAAAYDAKFRQSMDDEGFLPL